MRADIDRVLFAAHVVGCVIDTEDVMLVHAAANKCDGITFSIRKGMLITIIWNTGVTSK